MGQAGYNHRWIARVVTLFDLLAASPVKKLWRERSFRVGMAMIFAILAPSIAASITYAPQAMRVGAFPPMEPPGFEHPLGTDVLGRDILSQLFVATINSMKIGLIAAFLGTIIGSIIGFIGGYYGRYIDHVLRILTEVFLSIPMLLFLILISTLIRVATIEQVALLIALFSWAWPARQVRAQTLSLKEREFVLLAKLSGVGSIGIIFREIMPHMIPWMGANFVNAYIVAILTEAGLSILGLGPQTDITLGMMLWWALSHAAIFRGLIWWWAPPVFVLIFTFVALYLVHHSIIRVINPRAGVA